MSNGEFPVRPDAARPLTAYVPPQPAFTPCAFCGCPVALGRDAAGNAIAVSPLLGDEHLCGENCACNYPETR